MNRQVEGVTNGAVSAKTMNRCLSLGVAVSVGLAHPTLILDSHDLYRDQRDQGYQRHHAEGVGHHIPVKGFTGAQT